MVGCRYFALFIIYTPYTMYQCAFFFALYLCRSVLMICVCRWDEGMGENGSPGRVEV